jgi:anti-sigma regulatory factor (Ser/Thr protein kinase)
MFLAKPEEVRRTRSITRGALARYPQYDGELVVLLVSELASNSVRHSGSTWFWVLITLLEDGVRVAVTDEGRKGRPKMRADRSADALRGRGLQIVNDQARGWGVVDGGHYVAVWFEIGPPERLQTPAGLSEGGAVPLALACPELGVG